MSNITRREFIKQGALSLAAGSFTSVLCACQTTKSSNLAAGGKGMLRFAHVTDTHLDLAQSKTVMWVEMLVKKINRDFPTLDFVLFGGDNFNNNVPGSDDAITFRNTIDNLHCPSYLVRGNKESSPRPAGDQLNRSDFAKMFFPSDLHIVASNWKLVKGNYTILGLDSTVEQHDNGVYTEKTISFAENELRNHPKRHFILLNHHPYGNFWGGTQKYDIHRYVLNNADEVKNILFKYDNLKLTLSGHKHLDHVGKENDVVVIATLGFVVPQDLNNKDDHRFRYIEIDNGVVSEKLISIL